MTRKSSNLIAEVTILPDRSGVKVVCPYCLAEETHPSTVPEGEDFFCDECCQTYLAGPCEDTKPEDSPWEGPEIPEALVYTSPYHICITRPFWVIDCPECETRKTTFEYVEGTTMNCGVCDLLMYLGIPKGPVPKR